MILQTHSNPHQVEEFILEGMLLKYFIKLYCQCTYLNKLPSYQCTIIEFPVPIHLFVLSMYFRVPERQNIMQIKTITTTILTSLQFCALLVI